MFKAPSKPGTCGNTLTITTGHPAVPTLHLPVMLCVSQAVTVSPDRLDFGRVARAAGVSRALKLKLEPGTDLKAVTAQPKIPKILEVTTRPADAVVHVDVRLKEDAPYGPLTGRIALQIAGREQCTLTIPFAGYIADEPNQ